MHKISKIVNKTILELIGVWLYFNAKSCLFDTIMYFINPFYEPPILTSSEKHQKTMQISEILSLSKHQRTASDKRKVYEYFITHPFLR